MEKNRLAEDLKTISEIMVEALKKLASQGVDLNSETLLSELEKRKEIQSLFSEKEKIIASNTELTSQIEAVLKRNNRLLQQVNELDSEYRDKESFFRQALLTLIRMMPSGKQKSPVYKPLIGLKILLQKDSTDEELKHALENLKTSALSEDFENKEAAPKSSSFLSRIFKGTDPETQGEKTSSQTDYIQILKTAYQEFIDGLRLNIAKKDLDDFSEINILIRECTTLEELIEVRKKILSMVRGYTDNVSSERELTAEFIKEITNRLLEIEKQIIQSVTYTEEILGADGDYNTHLKEHIDELKTSINFSKSLEEVKTAVLSRLNTINEAIETKAQHDKRSKEESDRYASHIRQDLERMKKDILTAKERSKHLEEELLKDSLTGVFNRRAYDRLIEQEFNRYVRYGTVFSVILFDVDHFKKINDTYGHAVGDKCLTEIISRVRPVLRESDFLARYGGEEFIILLPETDNSSAVKVAEKLRSVVENIEFLHKKKSVKVTISLGVTEAAPGDKNYQEIFTRMDQAMYAAKHAGRNRVEIK
jgi:diguanylate cyclase